MFAHWKSKAQQWLLSYLATSPGTDTQARQDTTTFTQAPSQLYPAVSTYLSSIPIPTRQQVMLYLYDTNVYVEELTNRLSRAILGKTGFALSFEKPDTYTEGVLRDFWELNEMKMLETQEQLTRDYLVIGEVCEVIAPCNGSYMLGTVLAETIAQTILDPLNYHKVIGVKQTTGMMEYVYHKVIMQERTLTDKAREKRKQWQFPCFLFQNVKKTAPIPAPSIEEGERLQKRGEPFMFTASDIFKALVDYLWTSIDRVQALNTFNWGFKILVDGTKEQKREAAEYWKTKIGTPDPNTAFFYTDEIEPSPFAFPAGVASAIEGLYKLLRNTVGWVGSSRDEDMGDSDVKYASMRRPGVTNPSLETLVNIQTKCDHYHRRRLNYVLAQELEQGRLPKTEVDFGHGRRPKFRYDLTSPEISKQDLGQATVAFKTFEEAWEKLRTQGTFTPETLAMGEQKMIKELFGYEMEIQPPQPEIQIKSLSPPSPKMLPQAEKKELVEIAKK